eukprot:1176939-Prorocentrum_minimum.AAC.2
MHKSLLCPKGAGVPPSARHQVLHDGDADDEVIQVAVHVKRLPQSQHMDPLRGFLGTIDWVGNRLTGGVHRHDKCQSWLTHFALVLKFAGDNANWVMERSHEGVIFQRAEADFDGSAASLFMMSCREDHWPTRRVTRDDLKIFFHQQSGMQYGFIMKNCKHFCYDFYRYVLKHSWVEQNHFEAFCGTIEAEWSTAIGLP